MTPGKHPLETVREVLNACADDARKAHEWLESHVAMPHDIKTIVYSALSAASKEQEKGNE